ncbi:hypothetical protein WMY93_005421 [Mugilogobius chulae]|uniref:Integrase zinc-binding domain-containing protein n=1 Tax=Mugilogobius chulae TaxID=88201 RepID=A0AAW0PLG3_9GOBI
MWWYNLVCQDLRHRGPRHRGLRHRGLRHRGLRHRGLRHRGPRHQGLRRQGQGHRGPRLQFVSDVLRDGDFYYICRRRKEKVHLAKVVLTSEEADDIFVEFHAGAIGGHCGWGKTHRAIIDRYYWPGMQQDIKD